jgi:hypothetical protein
MSTNQIEAQDENGERIFTCTKLNPSGVVVDMHVPVTSENIKEITAALEEAVAMLDQP